MAKRKYDFSEKVRQTVLLWSDRHCCFCRKACGVLIEVDHILQPEEHGTNEIDNAMPLCFECHGALHHYNRLHPRGTKYFVAERKTRREQIYEEFTRHLVPPVDYQITQARLDPRLPPRVLPDVGFVLRHLGDHLPVRVFTTIAIKRGGKLISPPPDGTYYAGKKPWRLNPRATHEGHFPLPATVGKSKARLEVEVSVTLVDMYGRAHQLLPVGWVLARPAGAPVYWYFEPGAGPELARSWPGAGPELARSWPGAGPEIGPPFEAVPVDQLLGGPLEVADHR